jgi:hypothetical protein
LPAEELAELRRAEPVWWNEQLRGAEAFGDGGYWLVTRHADVRGACPSGAVSYLGHLDHVDVDSRRRDLLQLFGISS